MDRTKHGAGQEVVVSPPPPGLGEPYATLFTHQATQFVADLVRQFRGRVVQLHAERRRRGEEVSSGRWQPPLSDILSPPLDEPQWTVEPVPAPLQDRRLDLGDVSPANLKHFTDALCANVQGIQVDFDDGHCPTWRAGIQGHEHVRRAVHGLLPLVPPLARTPLLMLRPRAWNMTEHNMLVDGLSVPGPLFDFGLHMFHNGRRLYRAGRGPFLYLSKVESAGEAAVWDDIFVWTQQKLGIPLGTIKACVLIEDILAAFEMDGILSALRRHSAGLNCGIWDYCASIVARFGRQPAFLLPDRNKYVNMDQPFLSKYMQLAVRVCRRRGTVATGGMAALMVTSSDTVDKVVEAKRKEIQAGAAGFMVYDIKLVPAINKLWSDFGDSPIATARIGAQPISVRDLLQVPAGGVTQTGLEHNVRVALLFISHWTQGRGHFVHRGAVEDSATAEISRWQVSQWLQHQAKIEGSEETVSFHRVIGLISSASRELGLAPAVAAILLRLLTLQQPPQFITSHLADHILLNHPPTPSHL